MYKNKKSSRVKKAVVYTVLGAGIVFLLYIVIMLASGRQVFIFGYSAIRIETESMYVPGDDSSIEKNSFILIRKTDVENLCVGDIITFRSIDPQIYGKLNTHRIVEIKHEADNTVFVTKGDNPKSLVDAYTVSAENVVGKFRSRIPVMTVIYRALQNKFVFGVAVMVPALIFLLLSIRDLMKRSRELESGKIADAKKTVDGKTVDELVALEVERLKRENASGGDNTVNNNGRSGDGNV